MNRCRSLPSLCLHDTSFSERAACCRVQSTVWSASAAAGDKAEFIEKVRRALYLGKTFLTPRASLSCVLRLKSTTGSELWRNREDFPCWLHYPCAVLQKITDAYAENPQIANLLLVRISSKLPMTTSRRCAMSSLCGTERYPGSDLRRCGCLL